MSSKIPRVAKPATEADLIPEATIPVAAPATPIDAPAAVEPETADTIPANGAARSLDPETVRWMIAEAAYYKAELRDFQPGHEAEDWIAAEHEILSGFGAQ